MAWLLPLSAFAQATLIIPPHAYDTDGNGLSDIWQAYYNVGPVDPNDDLDGDGMTNAEEEDAGTDPLNAESGLFIAGIVVDNVTPAPKVDFEGDIHIRWPSQLGKMYQLEGARTVQGRWQEVGTPQAGTGDPIELHISPDRLNWWTLSTRGFFRLKVWDEDQDIDGLTTWEEGVVGTDDTDPDTGGGGTGDPAAANDWLEDNGPQVFGLNEVVLAHLGGSPLIGGTGSAAGLPAYDYSTRIVTAVGSAAWVRMTSWTIASGTHQPIPLADSTTMDGFDAQLLAIKPKISPNLTINPFLLGRLAANGNLWLKLYTLNGIGGFNDLATAGYGSHAELKVHHYAMDYRYRSGSGDQTSYMVVTPVIVTDREGKTQLRVATWRTTPGNNFLTGLQDIAMDADDVPAATEHLSIRHLRDHMHVVTYANQDGILTSRFIGVTDEGWVSDLGGAASGVDIRGVDPVSLAMTQAAAGGITPNGYVTATLDASDTMQLQVWEERIIGCDAGCYSRAFLISDNTVDTQPGVNGVQLPDPVLTDSGDETDRFGNVLATGDFNGDGYGDLAAGVPDSNNHAGEVDIFYGSPEGYSTTGQNRTFIQGQNGLSGLEEEWDQLGYALAVGDFNGDGYDDLAMGAPGESVVNSTIPWAGAVQVVYGGNNGLTSAGSQIWSQESPDIVGDPLEDEQFGGALAAGDFNGDGFCDLAVGISRQDVNGQDEAGAVQIIYGTQGGLHALAGPGNQLLHQDIAGFLDQAEAHDWFGFRLTAADFNGDNRADLAVGIPYEDQAGLTNNGAVQVIYGSVSGLGNTDALISQVGFEPGGADVTGAPESFDLFGWALTGADFNGDGFDDLAVSATHESVDNIEAAGAVHILYGTGAGLAAANNAILTQDGFQGGSDIDDAPEENDRFGGSLASGDYDDDGYADLLIGVQYESVDDNSVEGAGAAHLVYGGINGLSGSNDQYFYQELGDLAGSLEPFDWTGSAAAMIDVNGDGFADAILGCEGEDVGSDVDAGAALIVFGSATIYGDNGSQTIVQAGEEKVRARLTDLQWQNTYGPGSSVLFNKVAPAYHPPELHIASVTKCMTLLLAVEAILDGDVNLNDDVAISALAGTTGGSKMSPELDEGDVIPLEVLLHGMMMRSGNRASVAIGEHVGQTAPNYQVLGASTNFVIAMNKKAQELGMTDTVYGHPAGGCVTTPEDQTKLWLFARQYPLFLDIAGARVWDGCGVASNGTEKCFYMIKHSDSGYPGLGSWKGGNGGLWFWNSDEHWDDQDGVPWCTSSELGEATRLDRTLIAGISQTGDRWGDHDRLMDYGFRKLFTPDYRSGLTYVGLTITDFDLDKIHDTLAVTAVIDDSRLRVDSWQVVAGIGQVGHLATGSKTINDLPQGTFDIPSTRVRMTLLPTVGESTADPLTARIDGTGNLRFDVWRIAAEPGN